MTTAPDANATRILDLVLADLAHLKLYITLSWAVNVRDISVPTTDP